MGRGSRIGECRDRFESQWQWRPAPVLALLFTVSRLGFFCRWSALFVKFCNCVYSYYLCLKNVSIMVFLNLSLSHTHASIRRTPDRHQRADQRPGSSGHPPPGLPHLRHARALPGHRGPPCAAGAGGGRGGWELHHHRAL